MLNLKTLLENPEGTKAALTKRNMGADGRLAVDEIVHLGARRRDLVQRTEELRRTRNEKSALIGRVRSGRAEPDEGLDLDELIADVGGIKGELKTIETELNQVQERLAHYLDTLPNVLDDSVPKGETDEENIVERTWGTPRAFDFVPKDHKMLGETLGILDLARGARLTGSGFPLLRGVGARLERALINFMLDIHTTEHGYMEHWVPFAVNRDTMRGTGQLPKFEKDLYWAEDGALGLIPTAEVPLTNIHKGEILPENALPMNFTAFSPCFRQEAGQHGEETRGLIRVHQFSKVELVKIVHPDHSVEELEKLTANAELILQRLGLPYRVVTLCSGDTGFCASKTYDLEVWLPSQEKYREISSCSNCTDFQARRMNQRFRSQEDGKVHFVHTLNGSGVAVGRTWVALVENYQQADGSIVIPEVLRPYMGGLERIEAAELAGEQAAPSFEGRKG